MSITQEFKDFINRGNVVDMAVGIIVGSSFIKIVDALVQFLFNPILGLLIGGIHLEGFVLRIGNQATVEYGKFLNSVLDFFLISFSVFLFVKGFNTLKKYYVQQPLPSKKNCPFCDTEISKKARRCPHCTSEL